jgi:hypothetical protein
MITLIKTTETSYVIEDAGKKIVLSRVTQILAAFLPFPWSDEDAMARGSAIHKACALLDTGDLYWPSVNPEIVPYLHGWEQCKEEVLSKPRKHSLLIDIKSGVSHVRHHLQTAAYKLALVSEWVNHREPLIEQFVCYRNFGYGGTLDRYYPGTRAGSPIIRRACVYLQPEKYQIVWHEDPLDEAAFVGMAQTWHWMQKNLTKKEREQWR